VAEIDNKLMMNDKINNLKDKIQGLISQAVEKNNKQKECLNFLFDKLEEVKELETLEKLKEYENGKCLRAYLFYQSIKRANYQIEHLKLTKLDNIDKCLEMIEKDLEANQPKEKTPKEQLTDQHLLTLLAERIKFGKICLKKDGRYLFEVGKVGQPIPFKIFLDDGRTEPDLAEEFLKKHK
jgi:hypothetical protein